MKQIIILSTALLSIGTAYAQNPITWSWSASKVTEKEYEVKLTASIQSGWHLYSQNQPKDAIALPTEIVFNKNPLLELKDKLKENGKLEKYKDKTLDVEAWQYSGQVVFTQRIKMKASIKTALKGTVEFQACTDEKCLPPKKVSFSIAIQ